ncbi:hypothetical protein ACIBJI_34880 [Nocardia sp. NPDC050408]
MRTLIADLGSAEQRGIIAAMLAEPQRGSRALPHNQSKLLGPE